MDRSISAGIGRPCAIQVSHFCALDVYFTHVSIAPFQEEESVTSSLYILARE